MFNGIWPKPTNKRLNSAYLQIKYLISRIIHSNTFWLDKTFIFSLQVTMMFQKKRFFKNKKKIRVRFSIVDFTAKPAKQKKQVALKNHWGYTLAELRPWPRNGWINFLKFFSFLSKFLIWPSGLPWRRSYRKSPLDGATDFLAIIWQHITTVNFS